jgi:membrane protease YdiL (CAAX protease family)
MTTHDAPRNRALSDSGGGIDEQHSVTRTLVLHLVPGALTAATFYLAGPLVVRAGYPGIVAAIFAAGIVLVSVELGWLLREAHRRTGSWTITAVMPFRPPRFTWWKALIILGLFGWGLLVSAFSIGGSIKDEFFTWLPDWALDPLPATFAETGSSTAQAATAIGYLLFLVLLAPLVEELYFRGYLLPRLSRFGSWAPLINATLFATYHLWKPWDLLTLSVIFAPIAYAVWRLRDVRISIGVHVALNGFGWAINVAPTLLSS